MSTPRTLVLAPLALVACGGGTPTTPTTPALALYAAGAPITQARLSTEVVVRASGLVPGEVVTLASLMDPWRAEVKFRAATDGTIDTGRDAPMEGSYAGVDPDGLFWSMDTTPFMFAKSADVTYTLLRAAEVLAVAKLDRSQRVGGYTQTEVTEGGLVGRFFAPTGSGPFPALLAFGGAEGGIDGAISYAQELVPQGYAVLAVAYFGVPGLPPDLKDVPLEYFDRAFAWMKARPEIDPARLGAIGGSRGGELALLLAARRKDLRAVIADAPSGYVWGAVNGDGAAWTSGGAPLAWIPPGGTTGVVIDTPQGDTAISFTPMFLDDLAHADAPSREAARIRVEDAGAAIAMFGGADDRLWPSCDLAGVAFDALKASGHTATHADELDCFDDAGHLLSIVGLPTTYSTFVPDPIDQQLLAVGGTPPGIAHAGRARQGRLAAFLKKAL